MKRLKKISFRYNRKKINVEAVVCNSFEKMVGLMFKSKKQARILLFEFDKQTKMRIHSLFVFFPFVAIWLDDKKNVIEAKIVRPFVFSVNPKRPFIKLIEIPINMKYSKIVRSLISRR